MKRYAVVAKRGGLPWKPREYRGTEIHFIFHKAMIFSLIGDDCRFQNEFCKCLITVIRKISECPGRLVRSQISSILAAAAVSGIQIMHSEKNYVYTRRSSTNIGCFEYRLTVLDLRQRLDGQRGVIFSMLFL